MFEGFETTDIRTTGAQIHIWGARSHTGSVHRDVLGIWKGFGEDVAGGPIDCGHYVPEEAPDQTYGWLMRFFGSR